MTTIDRLTFAALLLAVPLQYYFLGFSLPNFVIELFTGIFPPISEWLPFWLSSALWITEALFSVDSVTLGEILLHAPRDEAGHVVIHRDRPEGLVYHIGDVVEHSTEGLRGVIIDWNVERSESEEDFVLVYMYTVLLDIPADEEVTDEDALSAQFFQQDVRKVTGYMTSNPDLHLYFEMYDGTKFHPREWLKRVYPNG
ncbi:hypothetical protein M8J77_015299 [Diaphorina citri]|nr:hypothetical protein M8J77_015299 [Diaphorina citri]